jgi:hypothetical protein
MNKEKNISDRKKEIIFNKCINLINKGYSFKYCEIKFAKYKSILEEYFPIIERIKKLRRNDLSNESLQNVLNKIYNDKSIQDIQTSYKSKIYRTRAILKPAIIFLSVFIFFSFSFVGIAYASQNTIPGEFLYPVKRSAENIKLFIYPESKKNVIHFELLNNRLNEARLLIDSDTIEKTITNNLIEEVDKEFNQCKKYNYFGDKSEKQIKDLINDIKDKYKGKFNKEKNQNGEKENINSKKQDNSIKNDSDINSKEEAVTSKDVKEAKILRKLQLKQQKKYIMLHQE